MIMVQSTKKSKEGSDEMIKVRKKIKIKKNEKNEKNEKS